MSLECITDQSIAVLQVYANANRMGPSFSACPPLP
jgi:hypothetical protein